VRTMCVLVAAMLITVGCGDSGFDGAADDIATPTEPEGGNIIFEFIYFDTELQAAFGLPTGVTTLNRIMAYFMDAQTPSSNPLPTAGVCNNLEATKGWPLHVGTPHTDLDVGTVTITGDNSSGDPVSIPVPIQAAGTDSIGRMHDTFYQALNPGAEAFVGFDRAYTVTLGGSATVEPTTFTDAIFISGAFDVRSPDLEDNGPLVAGTDVSVSWNFASSTNLPEGDEVLGVVWLVDTNGKPTHMCPTLHAAGTFTIPGSAITEYKAIAMARGTTPTKAILLRNAIVHRIVRLPNGETTNIRRIDMLGVNCWAQLVDVQ
jgi:hypothetical protein